MNKKYHFDRIINCKTADIVNISDAVIYFFESSTEEEKDLFMNLFPSFVEKYLKDTLLPHLDFFPYGRRHSYSTSLLMYEEYNKDKEVKVEPFNPVKELLEVVFTITHLYTDYDQYLHLFMKNRKLNISDIKKRLNIGIEEYIAYTSERSFLTDRNKFIRLLRKYKVGIETEKTYLNLREKYENYSISLLKESYTSFFAGTDNELYLQSINYDIALCEEMAKAYALLYLNDDLANWYMKVKKRYCFSDFHPINYVRPMEMIETTSDKDKLKEIITLKDIKTDVVWPYIKRYKSYLSETEKRKLEKELKEKITSIRREIANENKKNSDIRKQKVEEKKTIDLLSRIDFNLFLASDISNQAQFCELFDITLDEFNNCVSYLENTNNELYRAIERKINDLYEEKYTVIKNKVISIKDKIINGIKTDDNNVRAFDLLDYYLEANLTFERYLEIAKDCLTPYEITQVKYFFRNNSSKTELNLALEKQGKTIFMIDGVPHEVSENEIDETVNYLRSHNVPLDNLKVYKLALRRHVNGMLIDESTKSYRKN